VLRDTDVVGVAWSDSVAGFLPVRLSAENVLDKAENMCSC
jgi:hypothetical protein